MRLEEFKCLLEDAVIKNKTLNQFMDETGYNATAIRVNRWRLRNEMGIDLPALDYVRVNETELDEQKPQKVNINGNGRFIITSLVKGTKISNRLLKSLEMMALERDAQLIVVPIDYKAGKTFDWYDDNAEKYILHGDVNLTESSVISSISVNPTIKYPLSSFRDIYVGKNVIIGSPHLHYETRAGMSTETTRFMCTTMTLGEPNYKDNKGGMIASHKAKLGAIYIENDRVYQLEWDGKGVIFLGDYFTPEFKKKMRATAIVHGDSHLARELPHITDSRIEMAYKLNPIFIAHHDIYDHNSASHHSNKKTAIANYYSDSDSVATELDYVGDYLVKNWRDYKNVIVGSNHNDHLDRWLNEFDPRSGNVKNIAVYHELWHLMLSNPLYETYSALRIWLCEHFGGVKTIFPSRNERFELHGIDISQHGDLGVNGSRGATTLTKHGIKAVVGHTHSPLIINDTWWVGCANRNASYAKGYSTWDIVDVVIYENGKRQFVYHDVIEDNNAE